MYFQSVIGPTEPNRAVWMSGTNHGPPNNYIMEDNSETTKYEWLTYPEALTKANVQWQLYQDIDNFDDNPLAWFKYWQDLPAGEEKNKGLGFLGLQAFYDAAANGTLPEFSIIVGPTELSEHPENTPLAGSWLQQQIVNAVMNGKNWKNTALFINYDESGGYFDHVIPPQAPANEYVVDHWTNQKVPIGFGPRVPMVIVSPWTRGGNVFSEVSDHTSTLKFMEEWVGTDSNGKYLAPAVNVSPFARATSSNLINAFDFANPDYSIPTFDPVPKPSQIFGKWDPTVLCEINIFAPKTTPPYGNQKLPVVESGSRPIRGLVSEGRKLAFATASLSFPQAVQLNGTTLSTGASPSAKKRGSSKAPVKFLKSFLFKLIVTDTKGHYKIQSVATPTSCLVATAAGDKKDTTSAGLTSGDCKTTNWYFEQNGPHHYIREFSSKHYLNVDGTNLHLAQDQQTLFKIYSVTE